MTDAGTARSGGGVMGDAQPDLLAERYGRRPARSRRAGVLVAAAVAVLAALAWSGWVAVSAAREPVRWQSVGYAVRDAAGTDVIFDVSTRGDTAAVCTLEALNAGHAQVGRTDVGVPATGGATRRLTARIPTSERAVTGGVRACAPAR
jgi:hypothetical protein